jgi:hypothetical protein
MDSLAFQNAHTPTQYKSFESICLAHHLPRTCKAHIKGYARSLKRWQLGHPIVFVGLSTTIINNSCQFESDQTSNSDQQCYKQTVVCLISA